MAVDVPRIINKVAKLYMEKFDMDIPQIDLAILIGNALLKNE